MKTRYVVALAVVLGAVVGITTTQLRLRLSPWDGTASGVNRSAEPTGEAVVKSSKGGEPGSSAARNARAPKVRVDNDTFDFGTMDSLVPGHHDFVITNVGTGLLRLTKGESTCTCTKFELEKSELQPGQSMKVNMEWKSTGEGLVRNSGTIGTNDPERPTISLTVTGQVMTAIKLDPGEVALTAIRAGLSPPPVTIRLLGYLPEGFRIEKYEFVDSRSASCFDLKLERMTAEQVAAANRAEPARPADADEKPEAPQPPAAEKSSPPAEKKPSPPDAAAAEKPEKPSGRTKIEKKVVTCGYLAELTVKPGLPVGTFRQLLRFTTNVTTVPVLTIPISGSVVSEDFTVMGAGYGSGVLNIDIVSRGQETARKLQILASGPHFEKVNFEVVEVYPKDILTVELGKPVESLSKKETLTPLVIRIPKGSRQVDCLGTEQSPMGRILLKTGHPNPEAATLLIRVKFAVAG